MTTLNVRIEEKTKEKAAKVFEKMGLDMSGAVKLFLTQAIKENGLPFTPTNNEAALRARWDKEIEQARTSGKGFSSGKDLMMDMLGKKEYDRLSK